MAGPERSRNHPFNADKVPSRLNELHDRLALVERRMGLDLASAGTRNAMINGDMKIAQRGRSPLIGSGAGFIYSVDNFRTGRDGTGGTMTAGQQGLGPGTSFSGHETEQALLLNCTVAATGQTYCVTQGVIEDVQTFAGETVTISRWIFSDHAWTPGSNWVQVFGSGGSTAVYTGISNPPVAAGWTQLVTTISVPSTVGKTIGPGNCVLVELYWPINTVFTGYTMEWQIERGSKATPFERSTPQMQLAACMRFFQHWQQPPLVGMATTAANVGIARLRMPLIIPMRFNPSVSSSGSFGIYDGASAGTMSGFATNYSTTQVMELDSATPTVITAAGSGSVRSVGIYQTGTAYAELTAEF